MSCIHYKFKSSLDYNSVTFDGLHLSLADLKKSIIQQKRLKPGEFDLEITNAQTGDVYKKNDELIAKNTSVIVSRVPVNKTTASSTQKSWEAFKQECAKVKEKERLMTLEKLKQTPDLVNAPASEIDKIKAVIDQSTKGFETTNFLGKNQTGVPHENYVCKRCGQKGHFVSNCPNSNAEDRIVEPRYKRTTGIPTTMLTIVDDPMHPGALLTHHGQFAVPTVDVIGYRETKKERPPFLPGDSRPEPEKKKIPQELLCHICEDLCVDAAIAPCCGTSFCDECLREVLLESEDHQCPSCKETNVSPDRIVANRSMRLAVTNFLNDTGYTKAKRRRTLSSTGNEVIQTKGFSPGALSPNKPGSNAQSVANSSASPTYMDSQGNKNSASNSQITFSGNVQSNSESTKYPHSNIRSYGRPRFQPNQLSKPWRYSSDRSGHRDSSWRKDPEYSSLSSHSQPEDTKTVVSDHGSQDDSARRSSSAADNSALSNIDVNVANESVGRKEPLIPRIEPLLPRSSHHWQQTPTSLPDNAANVLMTPAHLLNAARVLLANSMPLLTAPPPTHRPYPVLPGYPLTYPTTRPAAPVPSTLGIPPVPLSKEEFYHAKKMFQQTEVPKKKPIDVFDSFADFTKRRSRTPERRKSYSRSRSGSWKKHSRSRSLSIGKKRSLSPRRKSSRSRSRSGQRSLNRSRSRSRQRSQHRSHSRSLGPSRISRSLTPLSRKSKSRSRSGPRTSKPLSPRARSPLPPLRRSSKSPLPIRSRSRSRSYKRYTRSRSKSWSKRARSRSYSRPLSPRPFSPRGSPRRSPLRSPHKSFSPRRKSRSYSPRRRSPFRSRSRTPIAKRKISRSRTRSPYSKRSSFSPMRSPRRTKSPYKKPLSPVHFRKRSQSPYRGIGQFRHRGRGRYGYRDNDRDKFRSHHSPSRLPPSAPAPVLPNNLPPVPYNPQMGLPPPEEYFKYNPAGYQEFVRNFYAQFGPQAQAWAQNQTFQLPSSDGIPSTLAASNPYLPGQRMPWDSVPMSPSQRPRSITPPRNRREQNYRDNLRYWDKDIRDRDRRMDRGRDSDRSREMDQHRKDSDRSREMHQHRKDLGDRKNTTIEEDKNKVRDSHRESKESARIRDKSNADRRTPPRPRDESKIKDKKKHEKRKEEKDRKSRKHSDSDGKKESSDIKESNLKSSPISDQELASPCQDEKFENSEMLKAKQESVATLADTKTSHMEPPMKLQQLVTDVETDKIMIKERKPVGKKKNDGLGSKKKSKDSVADESGEKKGKKTKKKKLTFGSSDADSKQGLKKKKVKRLVDYKSENCTSEEGEERGSPLKKAKLSEVDAEEKKDEMTESNPAASSHVNTTEPTFEVSTELETTHQGEKLFDDKVTTVLKPEGNDADKEVPASKSKSELVPELPELSKWERDDFDLFEAIDQPKEKPQEKMMLPRSVVDKAEKFLTYKPMKNAVIAAHTSSSKSPESLQSSDKRGADPATSRRVFIERKDLKDKKTNDIQITVKTDKNKTENTSKRLLSSSKPEKSEESRHRHQHYNEDYEEDQRSVVKSRSLERELLEKSKSRRSRERERKRSDKESKRDGKEVSKRDERKDNRLYKDAVHEKSNKDESLKKDTGDTLKEKERDSEPKERRHSKDQSVTTTSESHKSSKDLRHKLEEKAKSKSTIDPRKLSVLDESEFVPDYEDLAIDMSSDKEVDGAVASQDSGAASPESLVGDNKKRKRLDDSDRKAEETNTDSEELLKHKKSKKKHKHKDKKEKHKHKKKKHKHRKSKENEN